MNGNSFTRGLSSVFQIGALLFASTPALDAQAPQQKKGSGIGATGQTGRGGRGQAAAAPAATPSIDPATDAADRAQVEKLGVVNYLQDFQKNIAAIQGNTALTPAQKTVLTDAEFKKSPRAANFFECEDRAENALKTNARGAVTTGQCFDSSFGGMTTISTAFESMPVTSAGETTPRPTVTGRAALATDTKLDAVAKAAIAEKLGDIKEAVATAQNHDAQRLAALAELADNKSATSKITGLLSRNQKNQNQQQKKPALYTTNQADGISYLDRNVANSLNGESRDDTNSLQGGSVESARALAERVTRDLQAARTIIYVANGGKVEAPAVGGAAQATPVAPPIGAQAPAPAPIVTLAPKDKPLYDALSADLARVQAAWNQMQTGKMSDQKTSLTNVYVAGFGALTEKLVAQTFPAAKEVGIEPNNVPVSQASTPANEPQGRGSQGSNQQRTQQQQGIKLRLPIDYGTRRRSPVQIPGTVTIPVPGKKFVQER